MKSLLATFLIISSASVFASSQYLNCVLNEHNSVGSEENPIESAVYSTKLSKDGIGTLRAKAINFPVSASATIASKLKSNKYSVSLMLNQLEHGTTTSSLQSISSDGEVIKLKLQEAHESSAGSIVLKCKITKSSIW